MSVDEDIWSDGDNDADMFMRDDKRQKNILVKQGYREGRDSGYKQTLQVGFNAGFSKYSELAFRYGRVKEKLRVKEQQEKEDTTELLTRFEHLLLSLRMNEDKLNEMLDILNALEAQ